MQTIHAENGEVRVPVQARSIHALKVGDQIVHPQWLRRDEPTDTPVCDVVTFEGFDEVTGVVRYRELTTPNKVLWGFQLVGTIVWCPTVEVVR